MKIRYIKFIKIVFSLVLACHIYSCSDDFLEITPNGVLVAETANDYNLLLNSSKLSLGNGFDEILSSFEVCAIEPYWSNSFWQDESKNAFRWEAGTVPEGSTGVMEAFTSAFYIYNKIINEVLSSSGGSEAQKNSLMAQARASRAFAYFRLVNFYGKPYNAATASTDLGVPLITEADVTVEIFTRASVQEVYDFIIEDLTTAIPLLTDDFEGNRRMYKASAQALLAKVYMYMNRFSEALPLFDEALSGRPSRVQLFDYNESTLPGGVHAAGFLGPAFSFPVDHTDALYSYAAFHPAGFTSSDILLSPEVATLFGASDFRLHHFFSRKPFPPFPFTPEFSVPGVYRKVGDLVSQVGIQLSDIYLLRAECNARSNNLNEAISDLEFLRRHRMDPADAAVPSGMLQDDLIKYVIEERTREFALKSELWFDMRRLWDDPLFQDKKPYVHTVYNADGSVSETFTLTEDRLVFRFSDKVTNANPDLIQNP